MPETIQGREVPAFFAGLVLAAAFFAFSLSQPPEVAINISYVAPIIIGLLAHSRRLVGFFLVLGIALVLIGAVLSPGEATELLATTNNMLALFIMASVGGTCFLALSEQDRLNARLREAAERDPLTKLYNRRVMMKQLGIHLAQAIRYHKSLSFIILDVDNFKEVNDKYGHLVGDEILRVLSRICTRAVREADILCRYGGEEFAVLCPETDAEGAHCAAERIRRDIAGQQIVVGQQNHHITVSVGVASLNAIHRTEEALIKAADEGLYRAKAAGKNQVWSAGDEPEERAAG